VEEFKESKENVVTAGNLPGNNQTANSKTQAWDIKYPLSQNARFWSLIWKSESTGLISVSGVTYYTTVHHLRSKADHSSPRRADVRNARRYTSTEPYIFMVWCLIQHRDNFGFKFFN